MSTTEIGGRAPPLEPQDAREISADAGPTENEVPRERSVLYRARATAIGGREGRVRSDDGNFAAELTAPKELGGLGKPGTTNPEQLFAAGYAACFESAIRHVGRLTKTAVENAQVEAEVGLVPSGDGYELVVSLRPRIEGLDDAEARALIDAADRICPYSLAIRGNVDVRIEPTPDTPVM